MRVIIKRFLYFTGTVFFITGQLGIWYNTDDAVPYLLSSIVMILIAMYLKDDNK